MGNFPLLFSVSCIFFVFYNKGGTFIDRAGKAIFDKEHLARLNYWQHDKAVYKHKSTIERIIDCLKERWKDQTQLLEEAYVSTPIIGCLESVLYIIATFIL